MDILSQFIAMAGSFASIIIPFLVVLTVVVFFHELGHFMVARWCGVEVQTFSIGFGREICGFTDRKNTRWKLCWIPLGGYVKFLDDENSASMPDHEAMENMPLEKRKGSFHFKPLWQKAAVVFAGPLANFILAIVFFAALFMTFGERLTKPVIDEVMKGSSADVAGLQAGDIIKEIDGHQITSFNEIRSIITGYSNETIIIKVERDGRIVSSEITPQETEITDNFGNKIKTGLLGVRRKPGKDDWIHHKYGLVDAVQRGGEQTYFIVAQTLKYIGRLFTGRESVDKLNGPIGIANVTGQVATLGIAALINLTAILSVSIGLLNLFPIPMLDGGHLMFYAIEAIRGRPLSERSLEIGFRIGIAILVVLMVFATTNDIKRLIS